MKNYLKIFLLAFTIIFLLNACSSEDPVSEIPKGAMVYFSQGPDDTGLINALDLNGTVLNFTVDLKDARGNNLEFSPVESMDITVAFTNVSEDTTYKTMLQHITTWPQTYTISPADLVAAFQNQEITLDTLALGDKFQISADFHMQDGRFLSGWSPALIDKNPASVYSVLIDYPVACPSEIPITTYHTLTSGQSTDDCCTAPVTNLPGKITLAAVSPGIYVVDDIFAGLYIHWYNGYGLNFKVAENITDVCNQVSATFEDPFGGTVVMNGTYDPITQTITLEGSNEFGDTWTTVWTPE